MTRKLVEFDDTTFSALKLLAGDRMSTFQELADEAFADLLRKHGRPTETREAFKMSLAAQVKSLGTKSAGAKSPAVKPAKRRSKPSSRKRG